MSVETITAPPRRATEAEMAAERAAAEAFLAAIRAVVVAAYPPGQFEDWDAPTMASMLVQQSVPPIINASVSDDADVVALFFGLGCGAGNILAQMEPAHANSAMRALLEGLQVGRDSYVDAPANEADGQA